MKTQIPLLAVLLAGCTLTPEQTMPEKGPLHIEQAGRQKDAVYVFCYGGDCPPRTPKVLATSPAPVLKPAAPVLAPSPAPLTVSPVEAELSHAKDASEAPKPKTKKKKKSRKPAVKKNTKPAAKKPVSCD